MAIRNYSFKLFILFTFISYTILLASCSKSLVKPKNNDTTQTGGGITGGGNVYVAGYKLKVGDFGESVKIATVWKDGVATSLSDGTNDAVAVGVAVSGNDVYAVGNELVGNFFIATLWKNGKVTRLATTLSYATGIFVSGTDVYISGYVVTGPGTEIATVWKNGVSQPLPSDAAGDLYGLSVYYYANKVYVAGADDGDALSWIQGAVKKLTTNYGSANQVIVANNTVYTAGEAGAPYITQGEANENHIPKATIWKNNGTSQITLNGLEGGASIAYGVAASGKDLYAAGYEVEYKDKPLRYAAILWKNGVPTALSSYWSSANAITISGNDVYVAGDDSNVSNPTTVVSMATVWKNGTATHLTDGKTDAHAYAIFVK